MVLIISHIVSAVSCNRQSKIRQSKIQGLRFKIKPPNSLTFLEQLNFLFTNTTLTFIIFNIHFPLHWFQSDVFRYSRYKYWIISWLYETYTWQCLTFSSLKSNISLVIEIFYNSLLYIILSCLLYLTIFFLLLTQSFLFFLSSTFPFFFLLPFSLIFSSFFHFPHFKNKESTKVLNSQFFVLKHIFRSPEPAYKVSAIGVSASTKYAQIIENGTYKNYEIEKRFEFWYVAFKYDKDAAQNF